MLEQYPTWRKRRIGRFAFFIRNLERKSAAYQVGLRFRSSASRLT
jgi:hypothetical protein